MSSLEREFARRLALLHGTPFQDEVVRVLQRTFTGDGFQRIPPKPKGDGGLDGLSHNKTRAYCCYGPELTTGPTSLGKALRNKIVKKFKADLQRILELENKSKKLFHRPNTSIVHVLGDSPITKLGLIVLICNCYEDKQVYGDLTTAFDHYLKQSKRKFVTPTCQVVVWGPLDVAQNCSVSEQCLLRLEHPTLVHALEQAEQAAKTHSPPAHDHLKFNAKFDHLVKDQTSVPRKDQIEALRQGMREAWSKSLLLEQDICTSMPNLHQEFERARKQAVLDAQLESLKPGIDPFTKIENARNGLRRRMSSDVLGGNLPGSVCDDLSQADTGRLIGECALEWRSDQ